jgi:hypothetical protein
VHSTTAGCGANALALLTGTVPDIIARQNGSNHFSDEFMLRFLRARGFIAVQLTLCNVSVAETDIGAGHLLLVSQLYSKNEGTWCVIFNDTCFHNFAVYRLSTLAFLNRPLLSAYIVYHPEWKYSLEKESATIPKAGQNKLTFPAKSGKASSASASAPSGIEKTLALAVPNSSYGSNKLSKRPS